jgi:dihydroflavonol-4-reductase
VVGPPLDGQFGSSLDLMLRILKGRDPMLPPIGFPFVDVRDVAEMHLRALERPETAGRRYIAAAGSMTLADVGRTVQVAYPTRRIPTREAPRVIVRLLALTDPSVRAILPKLGRIWSGCRTCAPRARWG